MDLSKKYKIKITKNGPYVVTGGVPLEEKIITPKGRGYEFKDGRKLPQAETYALCRCGKSKNPPFCDGSHLEAKFNGEETASREKYLDRVERFEGPGIDLLDDERCAYARFCHRQHGTAWTLTDRSETAENRSEVIAAASECPTGRLTAAEKDGTMHEPDLEPSIAVLQDPQVGVSGGLYVKGGIPIESADGTMYEVRNRVTLCRCGKSQEKPFCDATHLRVKYMDKNH